MKLGVYVFATEYAMPIAEVARAAEERGIESLWVPEHTHIPTSRTSPWPGGPELPREYLHTSVYGATPNAVALDGYAKAGAERAVFALPSAGRETVLPLLDRFAGLAEAVR